MKDYIISAFSYDFYKYKGKISFKKMVGRKIKTYNVDFIYNTYSKYETFEFTAIPEEMKEYTYKIENIIIEIIKKIEEVKKWD